MWIHLTPFGRLRQVDSWGNFYRKWIWRSIDVIFGSDFLQYDTSICNGLYFECFNSKQFPSNINCWLSVSLKINEQSFTAHAVKFEKIEKSNLFVGLSNFSKLFLSRPLPLRNERLLQVSFIRYLFPISFTSNPLFRR